MNKSFWSAFQEDDGAWSWGRVASTFTMVSAIAAFAHVTWLHHAIPDPATLTGLAAWGIHPYGVNKAIQAIPDTWGKTP